MQPINSDSSCSLNYSSFCERNSQIFIAIAIIFFLGGLFVIFAAYQILPPYPNPISELGLAKLSIPAFSFSLFFISGTIYRALPASKNDSCPNADYRIAPRRNFTFTYKQVEKAIERLVKELKNHIVIIDGHSMSVYAIFSDLKTYDKRFLPIFDVDYHLKIVADGVCYGVCQELGLGLNQPDNVADALNQLDKDNVLYRQIKHHIYSTLSPSILTNFIFSTSANLRGKTQAEQDNLKKFWNLHMRSIAPHQLQFPKIKKDDFFKNTNQASTFLWLFNRIPQNYYHGNAVQGWVDLEPKKEKFSANSAQPSGHVFWFKYSPAGGKSYLIDTIDSQHGVFEFPNRESFAQGLHDQIKAFPNLSNFEIYLFKT